MNHGTPLIVGLLLAFLIAHRLFAWWCMRSAFAVRKSVFCRRFEEPARAVLVRRRADGRCIGVAGCSLWSEHGREGCDRGCVPELTDVSPS